MKVRTMLLSSFISMALITFIVGFVSFLLSRSTVRDNVAAYDLSGVGQELLRAEAAHNAWKASLEESFVLNAKEISVELDGRKCGFGTWFYSDALDHLARTSPEAADIIRSIEQAHLDLHTSARTISDNWAQVHKGLSEELYRRLSDHNAWATTLMEDILQERTSNAEADPTRCGFGVFLSSEENLSLMRDWPEYKEIMEGIMVEHDALHRAVNPINSAMGRDAKYALFLNEVQPRLDYISDNFGRIIALETSLDEKQARAREVYIQTSVPLLDQVIATLGEANNALKIKQNDLFDIASGKAVIMNMVIWVGIAAGVIIGLIIAIAITRSLTGQLGGEPREISEIAERIAAGDLTMGNIVVADHNRGVYRSMVEMKEKLSDIVSNVLAGTEQIATASEELATGNQDLSNRTEQQASALEETSAAIEEMNSSVKSNGDNTKTADQLSREAASKTQEGSRSVDEMITSMNDISESSVRIADIIEVINNISFQTNLLALNASIEAARAGEQGKGFAVVAVEVRKLAKRSDKAASEIAEIIKSSNKKVEEGVVVAKRAGEVLGEINDSVNKVTTLVAEISAASQEQMASVDQIDTTLSNLDENTQKNAAMVEEAASATEELSAQAQELNSNMQFFTIDGERLSRKKQKETAKPSSKPQALPKPSASDREDKSKGTGVVEDAYETFSELAGDGEFEKF